MTDAIFTNGKTQGFAVSEWRKAIVVMCLLSTGCGWSGKPDPAFRPERPDQVLAFDVLYRNNCSGCHGADGTKGPAPPLNDDRFRALVSQDEIERVVKTGRHGTPMPAFAREVGGTLTQTQIQVLTSEIKGVPYNITRQVVGNLSTMDVTPDAAGRIPQWGVPAPVDDQSPIYRVGRTSSVATQVIEIETGKQAFDRACATCHGKNGRGTTGHPGPPNSINSSAFLTLISDQAVRRLIITGRRDLGMPGYADPRPNNADFAPLNSEEILGLTELLATWRGAAADND